MSQAVTQEWIHNLSLMQQSVLLSSIRGPDGAAKYHPVKYLLRWYRRCILFSALDNNIFLDPYDAYGGSFTGPSYTAQKAASVGIPIYHWEEHMNIVLDEYLKSLDGLPHHFQLHFLHAAEILGYKHPAHRIRDWWHKVYLTLVYDMHLNPESEAQLDYRLDDNETQWRNTSSKATQD